MEITKDFEFRDLTYNYANGTSISLSGMGRYTVASSSDLSTEDEAAIHSDFLTALTLLLTTLAAQNADHTALPRYPDSFSERMRKQLSDTWQPRGWEMKHCWFTALYPDEASVVKLIEAKRTLSLRRVCPNCGKDLTNDPKATFCNACGAKLGPPPAQSAPRTPTEEYILSHFSKTEKIEAIKYYMQETGANLSTAKAAVEQLFKRDVSKMTVADLLIDSSITPDEQLEVLSNSLNKGIQKLKNFFGNGKQ